MTSDDWATMTPRQKRAALGAVPEADRDQVVGIIDDVEGTVGEVRDHYQRIRSTLSQDLDGIDEVSAETLPQVVKAYQVFISHASALLVGLEVTLWGMVDDLNNGPEIIRTGVYDLVETYRKAQKKS